MEGILTSFPLCLLNNGSATHFQSQSNTFSAIDLSLCSPSLYLNLQWKVDDNSYGNDHLPILIKQLHSNKSQISTSPKWIFEKADWNKFSVLSNLKDFLIDEM